MAKKPAKPTTFAALDAVDDARSDLVMTFDTIRALIDADAMNENTLGTMVRHLQADLDRLNERFASAWTTILADKRGARS